MVTHLDRLARSTRDLLNTVAAITGKKAGFKSLGDTWADSTTAHGRLMLAVLGGLAEFESALINARTGEGRARAKERGVKMGRKPTLTPPTAGEIWTRTPLYSFTGGIDGGRPAAGLILDAAGALYGTTFNGGNNGHGGPLNNGTVFELK
jgi:hypothetical protein